MNFHFYGGLGLLTTLLACLILLPAAPRALAGAVLAVAAGAAARRLGRVVLDLHAAVYVVAAALWSGLPADLVRQVAGSGPPPAPGLADAAVWAAALVVAWQPVRVGSGLPVVVARSSRRILAALIVTGATGTLAWAVVAAGPEGGGLVGAATVRSVLLALAGVATARLARRPRFEDWGVLVYPLLAAGGLKLLADDLQHSAALELFVALAVYGAALLVAPRLMRRSGAPAPS